MSDVFCVINRKLCQDDFWQRFTDIAAARPRGIVLRAKELPANEYEALATEALKITAKFGANLILHNFFAVAQKLQVRALHLPLDSLRKLDAVERKQFAELGTSCHSIAEAKEAESLGCTYIFAGHIFATACKAGQSPRGLNFLQSVCHAVHIPVYAIGGIDAENAEAVRKAGAAGLCVMSGVMQCKDVADYLKNLSQFN